jgi:hypothetical protein
MGQFSADVDSVFGVGGDAWKIPSRTVTIAITDHAAIDGMSPAPPRRFTSCAARADAGPQHHDAEAKDLPKH